jgi:hypothetical protein
LADEEAIELGSEEANSTAPVNISRPHLQRNDSSSVRSRGGERHITAEDLEDVVLNIKEKKYLAPLTLGSRSFLAPGTETPAIQLTPTATAPAPVLMPAGTEAKSTNSRAPLPKEHTVFALGGSS